LRGGQQENVDQVLAMPIHQHGHALAAGVVDAPADQRSRRDMRAIAATPNLRERVDQRIFDAIWSRNLVYNTCWEDPPVDREALALGPDDTVLVITSAGCNALDYALQAPSRVYAVDANPRQNALLELKLAGIRGLAFDDYFAIFGEGWHARFADLYRVHLRAQVGQPCPAGQHVLVGDVHVLHHLPGRQRLEQRHVLEEEQEVQRGFAGDCVHLILEDTGQAPVFRSFGGHLYLSGNAVCDVAHQLYQLGVGVFVSKMFGDKLV
jgi:hypothetical protein